MNQAIKERIEKIKRGEVPEGYKTIGNIGIIPVEWPEGVLSEVLYHEVRAVPKPTNAYWRLGLRSHAKGTFHELVQDPETVDMEELFEVKENDLIVNITFAWEHAVAIASKEDEGKLVSHRFPTYVFNHGSSPQFFKYIVMQRWFRKLLENISPGGAGRNRVMSKPAFLKLPCYIPPLHEQEKIAEILSTWDKAIMLMENLIEQKKKQKKWLMQNLLDPERGVRLPGFEGEWVEKSLESLCTEIIDGDWIESKDQSDSGIRLIQTGNIGIGAFLDKFERARYINEETFTRLHCTEIFEGDILISRLPDPIGRACVIKSLKERAIAAVDCSIVRFKTKSEAEYFIQYACSEAYFKKVAVLSGGSTRTRISRKEIEKLTIPLPSDTKEQIAISKVLATAGYEIDLLEQKLEQLQKQKKALMQLLLTGIVRVTV